MSGTCNLTMIIKKITANCNAFIRICLLNQYKETEKSKFISFIRSLWPLSILNIICYSLTLIVRKSLYFFPSICIAIQNHPYAIAYKIQKGSTSTLQCIVTIKTYSNVSELNFITGVTLYNAPISFKTSPLLALLR